MKDILIDKLTMINIFAIGGPTVSGLDDHDYPNLNGASMTLTNINQIKIHSKIPLPSEVMEHFGRILSTSFKIVKANVIMYQFIFFFLRLLLE